MKIICIGRNYVDHTKELNNPIPKKPVFFMKPETSLLQKNNPFFYPEFSEDIHHEIEVVIKISKVGKHIQKEFAPNYYEEIGLGIDFTARDLQASAKAKGLPWEIAKAFDHAAPIGKFLPKSHFTDVQNFDFELMINSEIRQQGNTNEMIFSIDEIIAYISQFVSLKIGDLIYTGTPAGVGSVSIGDRLQGFIGDEEMFDFEVK
ncbi:MAG: fumarylacetoacetate hydrolase family protein [Bacteroidales bacterium]|jgi:acylpyruvate hydrolase|nr:fumarylacetoacetate hydrolase family protein [Bacteroidales bacterium]